MATSKRPRAGRTTRGQRRAPRPPAAPRMGRAVQARVPPIPPELLRTLRAYAETLREEHHVPGLAYSIVQGDSTVATECLGCLRADAEGRCPEGAPQVTPDTVFGIGSITKGFTATHLARLVDAGALGWEDPVRQHLRGFALLDHWMTREFRVSDIITHRSGLPAHSLEMMTVLGFGQDDIVRALRYVEPVTSFRSTFAYQNSLLILASQLIERKTGLPWEKALLRDLLEPLGMSRSTADPKVLADWRKKQKELATGHVFLSLEEGKPPGVIPIPDDWPHAESLFIDAPSGALYSSVKDMARWMRLHLGRGTLDGESLLSEQSLAYLHTPRMPIGFALPASADCYATGWIYRSMSPAPLVWHSGATILGMQANLWLIPDARTGMVVLSNLFNPLSGTDVTGELVWKFLSLYLGSAEAAARTPREVAPAVGLPPGARPGVVRARRGRAAPDASTLCGTFVNPAYGPFRVEQQGEGLVMFMGPKALAASLVPVGGLAFEAHIPDLWLPLLFEFKLDSTGRARELRGEDFRDVVQGRFFRRD